MRRRLERVWTGGGAGDGGQPVASEYNRVKEVLENVKAFVKERS